MSRQPHVWTRGVSAAIFIVALFVRLAPLGLYVTPDEPIWVLRSLRLLAALESKDWSAVPQTGHPGMTTMALGALGAWLTMQLHPAEAAVHLDWAERIATLAPENSAAFPHLVYFLPAGRVLVAVVAAAGLALVYHIGRQRLGEKSATMLGLLLALDPFFAGHAGLLHTDALQATFVLLAVILAMPSRESSTVAATSYRLVPEILSLGGAALFQALAGLTKVLGLLSAPGLALAVLLFSRGSLWRRAVRVAALAAMTVAFLFLLYPPFWIDPRAAVQSLISSASYHEGIGLRPVFFAGQTGTDPGPWFYPAVMLFRMTPPVLVGLLLAAGGRHTSRGPARLQALWALLPALSYLGSISIAEKAFDRYVLTAIPMLTMVAALFVHGCQRKWRLAVLASLGLPWALMSVVPLQYANPLLGGPWVAQYVVPLGWGEASGLAASRIDGLVSPVADFSVMTRNVPGTAGLFAGETWSWADTRLGCTDLVIGQAPVLSADYNILSDVRVAGRQQTTVYIHRQSLTPQRRLLAPGPLPGVAEQDVPPLADTGTLQTWLADWIGAENSFIWLHAPQCYPLTEAQLRTVVDEAVAAGQLICEFAAPIDGFDTDRCQVVAPLSPASPFLARFGGAVDLVAAAWESSAQPPDPMTVHLRWQAHTELAELEVYLSLQDEEGVNDVIWAEGGRRLLSNWGWPAPAWPVNQTIDADAYVSLPLKLAPGTYHLVLSVASPDGWLGLSRPDGAFGGTELLLGRVQVMPGPYPASELDLLQQTDVQWHGLRVVGLQLLTHSVQAGRRLDFDLGLERVSGTPPEALLWELECGGRRLDGGSLSWGSRNPADWAVGHKYVARYAPRLDPALPEGLCSAYVLPVDSASISPTDASADDPSARVLLGIVDVGQRPRSYVLPSVPQYATEVSADGLADLVGADLSAVRLSPGEPITVTLYWRALGNTERDYSVFVHAVGPDGQVWGQSDAWPAQGGAPTMTWAEGEVIEDRHVFDLHGDAPSGSYELYVGLYDARDGTRVSLHEEGDRLANDRARIAELEVGP